VGISQNKSAQGLQSIWSSICSSGCWKCELAKFLHNLPHICHSCLQKKICFNSVS